VKGMDALSGSISRVSPLFDGSPRTPVNLIAEPGGSFFLSASSRERATAAPSLSAPLCLL
jgi:hypothetical protein